MRKPVYTLFYQQYMPAMAQPAFRARCMQSLTLARRKAKSASCICDLKHPSGLRIGYLVPDDSVKISDVVALMLGGEVLFD